MRGGGACCHGAIFIIKQKIHRLLLNKKYKHRLLLNKKYIKSYSPRAPDLKTGEPDRIPDRPHRPDPRQAPHGHTFGLLLVTTKRRLTNQYSCILAYVGASGPGGVSRSGCSWNSMCLTWPAGWPKRHVEDSGRSAEGPHFFFFCVCLQNISTVYRVWKSVLMTDV